MADSNLIALLLVIVLRCSAARGQSEERARNAACDQAQVQGNLVDAVLHCDIRLVQSMLERSSVHVNEYFVSSSTNRKRNETALHVAVTFANDSIALLLVQKGADLDAKDSLGDTPLHNAAESGPVSIVTWLILNGAEASVNVKNVDGYTPLHNAAFRGDYEIVRPLLLAPEILVNEKTNLDPTNSTEQFYPGWTALHFAADRDSTTITPQLIQAGADISLRTAEGDTALQLAQRKDHTGVVVILSMPLANLNDNNDNNFSPLHAAVLKGLSTAIIELLRAPDADANVKSKYGNTPLHCAAVRGTDSSVIVLLENGADINVKDNVGLTALHYAALFDHASTVSALLQNGADVNAKDNSRSTPLHYATVARHPLIISALLLKGADVTVKNNERNTPLHLAAMNDDDSIVSALLRNGADVDARNGDGYTALHYAIMKGQALAGDSHYRSARVLVLSDALVNVKTSSHPLVNPPQYRGWTALHFAASRGSAIMVRLLLQYGADRSLRTDAGDTALMLAENGSYSDIALLLMTPLME